VTRLRELEPALWIRGNGERWTARPDDAPEGDPVQGAIAACRAELGDDVVDDLASLPFDASIDDTGIVHASPVSDVRSFLPEPGDDEAELLEGVEDDLLVFGHTHLPFERVSAGGTRLVNPGSVGMPFDGDTRAAYALLDDDGRVEHRRVAYDHAASAAAVSERFEGDWTDVVARRIETAQF
jgi:diadenosine tetraphosphatase ApaH/serine/threonine PP2A family protein phosphatase